MPNSANKVIIKWTRELDLASLSILIYKFELYISVIFVPMSIKHPRFESHSLVYF